MKFLQCMFLLFLITLVQHTLAYTLVKRDVVDAVS